MNLHVLCIIFTLLFAPLASFAGILCFDSSHNGEESTPILEITLSAESQSIEVSHFTTHSNNGTVEDLIYIQPLYLYQVSSEYILADNDQDGNLDHYDTTYVGSRDIHYNAPLWIFSENPRQLTLSVAGNSLAGLWTDKTLTDDENYLFFYRQPFIEDGVVNSIVVDGVHCPKQAFDELVQQAFELEIGTSL